MKTFSTLATLAATIALTQARPYMSPDGRLPSNTTFPCPNPKLNITDNHTNDCLPPFQLADLNDTNTRVTDESSAHSHASPNQTAVFYAFLGFMVFLAFAYPTAVCAGSYFWRQKGEKGGEVVDKGEGEEMETKVPGELIGEGEGEDEKKPSWLKKLLVRAEQPTVVV